MRRVWMMMACLILSLSLVGCASKKESIETIGDYYITGAKDVIKLREEADDESEVITKLNNGEKVQLIETEGVYFKVYVPAEDVVGYLSKYYLTNDKEAVSEPLTRYASEDVVVYGLPEEDASKVGSIPKGSEITLMASLSGDYDYVYCAEGDIHGYALKDQLSKDKVEEEKKESTTTQKEESTSTAQKQESTPTTTKEIYYSHVQKGYLALRTAPAYDYSNEIAALYNGTQVEVLDKSNGQYWWVYVPSVGSEGYVNASYLYQ